MGIIDEKGRLFGKINIVDFLVILFLLCILPAFYFGYEIITKRSVERAKWERAAVKRAKAEAPKREFIEIEIDCQFIKLKPEVLRLISVGDRELNENEQVIGEMVQVGKPSPYKYKIEIGSGQKIIKENVLLKQIPVVLKIMAETKGNKLFYKGKQMLENSTLHFKTDRYEAEGIVLFKLKTGPDELTLPEQIVHIENTLKEKQDRLDGTINTLKQNQDTLDGTINTLKQNQDTVDDRINTLEEKVDTILSSPRIKRLIKKK